MRPWWNRRAVELLPEPVGSKPGGKDVNVVPPRESNPDAHPELTDADRANMWKGIAETRLTTILDLRSTIDRLRADAALGTNGERVKEYIDLRKTLLRYEDAMEVCRREHLDKDAADALRAQLAYRIGAAQPW